MQNPDQIIRTAEDKWLDRLFVRCTEQFTGIHLPSHDEYHHRRVWNYAKQLIDWSDRQGSPFHEMEVEGLLIAVFFHDQGMSVSLSKNHGDISRKICKDYLNHLSLPAGFPVADILHAVEFHDKKEYGATPSVKELNLLALLNIADDLDAFGVIGIYRYIEIGLLRNTPVPKLAEPILENLSARFQHFSDIVGHSDTFAKSQKLRYMAARNFFKDLNFQLKQLEYDPAFYIGPIGVVNYIRNEIIAHKKAIPSVCDEIILSGSDFYTRHFFKRLKKEF